VSRRIIGVSKMSQGINVVGYATLTVEDSVVSLADASTSLPSECKRALITCRTGDVSWRADGTDPAAATDHLLGASKSVGFMKHNYRQLLENIKFIRDADTSGVLQITYFD
jgi:hypothetical protein